MEQVLLPGRLGMSWAGVRVPGINKQSPAALRSVHSDRRHPVSTLTSTARPWKNSLLPGLTNIPGVKSGDPQGDYFEASPISSRGWELGIQACGRYRGDLEYEVCTSLHSPVSGFLPRSALSPGCLYARPSEPLRLGLLGRPASGRHPPDLSSLSQDFWSWIFHMSTFARARKHTSVTGVILPSHGVAAWLSKGSQGQDGAQMGANFLDEPPWGWGWGGG